MCSGTAACAFYGLVINRVDVRAGAIDQEPFGIGFYYNEPLPSGTFAHHGNWPGRTEVQAPEFWDYFRATGGGHARPIVGLPTEPITSIYELDDLESLRRAFQAVSEPLGPAMEEYERGRSGRRKR